MSEPPQIAMNPDPTANVAAARQPANEARDLSAFDIFEATVLEDDFIDSFLEGVFSSNDASNGQAAVPAVSKPQHKTEHHPGLQVALNAAAIDHDIEKFRDECNTRPSEFKDLTTMLDPSGRQFPQENAIKISKPERVPQETKIPEKKPAEVIAPPLMMPAPRLQPVPIQAVPSSVSLCKSPGVENRPDPQPTISPSSVLIPAPIPTRTMIHIAPANGPQTVPAPGQVASSAPPPQEAKAEHRGSISSTDQKPAAKRGSISDSDLNTFAKTAVANFIQNAATRKPSGGAVDTSTKHIQDLTGENWMEAISAKSEENVKAQELKQQQEDPSAHGSSSMTFAQRLRLKRERNKESARILRLRKKAHVDELERTLHALVSERAASDLERHQAVQRQNGLRHIRFNVLQEFLKLRGRRERNKALWSAILEEDFTFRRPAALFSSSPIAAQLQEGSAKVAGMTVLSGVDATMKDVDLVAALARAKKIVESSSDSVVPAPAILYRCNRQALTMDGPCVALEWEATAANVPGVSANLVASPPALKGSMLSRFNPATNKLVSVTMFFDTGAVHRQLRATLTSTSADAMMKS